MRTTKHGEICISNDDQTIGEEGFYLKWKGEEREQTDGETERERESMCVGVLVNTDDSDGQYPQTSWDRETHLATIDRQHLWSISEDFWERSEMMFLMVGLMFGSDIWIGDNSRKGYLSDTSLVPLKFKKRHILKFQKSLWSSIKQERK